MKFEEILITDPLLDEDVQEIKKLAKKTVYNPTVDREQLLKILGNTEVLVVRSRTKVDKEVLKKAGKLRFVVTATHGIDHIDVVEARKNGAQVHSCPSSIQSVAELVFGNLITLYRHIPKANETTHQGKWIKNQLIGSQLSGKTMGIVGLGRIGRRVAQIAHYGFNMNVVYYDPYVEPGYAGSLEIRDWTRALDPDKKDEYDENFKIIEGFSFCRNGDYKTLLKESDVISFHCPLTKETKHMFGKKEINLMKKEAVIINFSRGEVVHDPDVVDALTKGKLAAAALDVFEKEPLPDKHPFINSPNLILTPHIGGQTLEARRNIGQTVIKILKRISKR
ncbi:NAD(P)-dependent oxidoreductase [Candidatus Altiarchaeota archaeon]